MTEKTDDVKILTEFLKHLGNAVDLLEKASKELCQVKFTKYWWITDRKHIEEPTEAAHEAAYKGHELAKEALAWCMVSKFETEQEIERGE